MSEYVGLAAEVAAGLLIMGVAHLVSARICRSGAEIPAGGRGAEVRLTALLGLLLPAAMVLLLTQSVLGFCQLQNWWQAWLREHTTHTQAWLSFWWLTLLIGLLEFLARFYFGLRGRPFPVPNLIRNLLRGLLLLAAALLVVKYRLGRDISTALASTALVTAVIGFALQGVLGNLLAGMSLHIVRSTVPGDWVAIGDVEGEVIATNWRETRLRTVAGHVIILPNSKVAESVIHNMTYPNALRRHRIAVGASYSDAPAAVIEALVASAASVPAVLTEPPPSAFLTEYKDFGINYDLRFWTNSYYDRTAVQGDVQRMIWYQFKRRGIEIPFPMSDKLLNDFMEVVYEQRSQPPQDSELDRRVNDLQQSDFCRRLLTDANGRAVVTADELRPVAHATRHQLFTAGERIFMQGEAGDTAYVLVRGAIKGRVDYQDAGQSNEFELAQGALFGEMSLLTGLPRTATLLAAADAELLAIPKEAFTLLLGLRPDIPAKLSELVAQRAAQNAASYERIKSLGPVNVGDSLRQTSILRRFMQMLGHGRA